MLADEFEKKIQDKMEGFELVPDDKVWEQVSMQIKKEKKKRRVLLYWMFAGFILLAGTLTIWFINDGNNRKLVINRVNNNVPKIENYKIKENGTNSLNSLKKVHKTQLAKNEVYLKKDTLNNVFRYRIKKDGDLKIENFKNESVAFNVNTDKENTTIENEERQTLRYLPPHRFYNPGAKTPKMDNSLKNDNKSKRINIRKDTSANSTARQIKEKRKKKQYFGFTAYSGISNNLTGIPLLKQSYQEDNSSTPSTGGNYNYSAYSLKNFKHGFSLGIGIFVKKDFTKKISMSAGVDYQLYTATLNVG